MNYALIREMDISNGPGIRVSLFVSGCGFHCPGCFNQDAQDFDYGQKYTQETEDKILSAVSKPHVSGLSILGGDPLWQNIEGLKQLKKLCTRIPKEKSIWLWTGFTWEDIFSVDESDVIYYMRNLVKACDVLVDGKYDKELKDYRLLYRGSSNQRIIDVQSSLREHKINLWH